MGTPSGHEGAAHCRESSRSTPAHRQTSLLLPVLRTYFRCSDAPRSRGVGKESANSPSFAPPEEELERGSRDCAAVGAARTGCPAQGCGSSGQRRRPRTSDSGEGGLPPGGDRAASGAPQPTGEPSPARTIPAAPGSSVRRTSWKGDPTGSAPGSRRGGCPGVGYVPKLLAGAGEKGSPDNTAQTFLRGSIGRKHPSLRFAESRRKTLGARSGQGPAAQEGALRVPGSPRGTLRDGTSRRCAPRRGEVQWALRLLSCAPH